MTRDSDHAISAAVYNRYLNHLLDGDRAACRATVESLMASELPPRLIYEGIFQRALYEVGSLWERGKVSVATEHLATATTESLMALLYPAIFDAPHTGRSAVVSCVANEYHQIGGKMVADTFELNGWHGYFLGANTPMADLLALIGEKRPDVVALSLTVYFSLDALLAAARAVRAEFPEMPVLVGGQAFRWGGSEQVLAVPGTRMVRSLFELEQVLTEWEEHG